MCCNIEAFKKFVGDLNTCKDSIKTEVCTTDLDHCKALSHLILVYENAEGCLENFDYLKEFDTTLDCYAGNIEDTLNADVKLLKLDLSMRNSILNDKVEAVHAMMQHEIAEYNALTNRSDFLSYIVDNVIQGNIFYCKQDILDIQEDIREVLRDTKLEIDRYIIFLICFINNVPIPEIKK